VYQLLCLARRDAAAPVDALVDNKAGAPGHVA
jgi:hypothetical protein